MVKMAKIIIYIIPQKLEKIMSLFRMELIMLSLISPSPDYVSQIWVSQEIK